ncbi:MULTISPECIES: hypothetical protein [unclassified Isoptericola]|uniref:hypothetical protein n=1 Tax=unclassified Isoptericola TaxID=2623355 RepID=UPI003661D65B
MTTPTTSRSRRRTATLALVAGGAFLLSGCNAPADEISGKRGDAPPEDAVAAAVDAALPDADTVDVGSHKNGFAQQMSVDVFQPGPAVDADTLRTVVDAVCSSVFLTDDVALQFFQDAEDGGRIPFDAAWDDAYPEVTPLWTSDGTAVFAVDEVCGG